MSDALYFNEEAGYPGLQVPDRPLAFFSLRSDDGACGHLRSLLVEDQINARHGNCMFNSCRQLISDENFLKMMMAIRLQRCTDPQSADWLEKVLLPLRDRYHFKLVYDIDDLLLAPEMPAFNIYRPNFFQADKIIEKFMRECDVVTFSTRRLELYFQNYFSLPPDKLRILPNFYPRQLIETYSLLLIQERLQRQRQRRPRIAFSCSTSHFDWNNVNAGDDDFSAIADWIIANRKRYQFLFLGNLGPRFLPYVKDFIVSPEVPFLHHFPRLRDLDIDLIIQPLLDCEFNRCKSIIKFWEGWGNGIPVFCSDTANYAEFAPDFCFASPEQLDQMVSRLFSDVNLQFSIIRQNHQYMTDHHCYLEHHADEWLRVLL